MRHWFTFYRWRQHQWQMYALIAIAWASGWQIHNAPGWSQTALSWANLAGALVCLFALHLRDTEDSRAVERWGTIMLVWSISAYLALALQHEGWWGLIDQPNFGIVLPGAIILASVHRFIHTIVARRVERRKSRTQHEACEIVKDLGIDPHEGYGKLA